MKYPRRLRLETMQENHLAQAIACINENFVQGDPVARALSLTKADCLLHDTIVIEHVLPEQVSMVALDDASNQLLGCLIAKDFCTPFPEDLPALCPKMAPVFALIERLESEYVRHNVIRPGEICYGLMAAVQQDANKQGIFTALSQAALQQAKRRGFRKTLCVAAHAASQHVLLTKCGQRVAGKVDFHSFSYQGKRVLAGISHPSSCLLLEGDL